MRTIVLFFLFLCFLFVGRHYHAYDSVRANGLRNTVAQTTDKIKQLGFSIIKHDDAVIKHHSAAHDGNFPITDFDEDENNPSARRYILLAQYSLIVSFTLVLSYLFTYLKERLPIIRHLSYISSYKYIVQRALRI
jgi:hypothetical protein